MLRAILIFLIHCCGCINTSVISNGYPQSQLVQQCIKISTGINSSSVHAYILGCFIPNVSNSQHCALSFLIFLFRMKYFVWCCWPHVQKHFRQGLKGESDISTGWLSELFNLFSSKLPFPCFGFKIC